MLLLDTGERHPTDSGQTATARDMDGKPVLIVTSKEAIENFGWEKIFKEASHKYTHGDIEAGHPPRVTVVNGDFEVD